MDFLLASQDAPLHNISVKSCTNSILNWIFTIPLLLGHSQPASLIANPLCHRQISPQSLPNLVYFLSLSCSPLYFYLLSVYKFRLFLASLNFSSYMFKVKTTEDQQKSWSNKRSFVEEMCVWVCVVDVEEEGGEYYTNFCPERSDIIFGIFLTYKNLWEIFSQKACPLKSQNS